MTDLVLGKGRLYFERFLPNTRNRSGEGFAYFGNTPELTVTTDEEKLEHYSSEGGLGVKDASVTVSSTRSGGFTTDHISPGNLALWYRGDQDALTQLAGADVVEQWASVKKGNYFQLGEGVGQPQGVRKVTVTEVNKGGVKASGTLTFSTAVPVAGDDVTIDGVNFEFVAAAANQNQVTIGATIGDTAAALRDAVNAYTGNIDVIATAAGAVTTVTAKAAGTPGNAIALLKSFATAGNMTLSAATLAGGTDIEIEGDENFTYNSATGLFHIKADAPDVLEGDSITITYDNEAASLTTVVDGSTTLEGRMLFVADNPVGENKDHLWPYIQLSADGDYALIGEEWQQMSFTYEVLKLDDDTPREIITNRG